MYEQIAYGVLVGVGYSIAGFTKANTEKKKKAKFEWPKFAKSVVVCGLVGGMAGYSGQDFNVLITGSMGVGATKVVDLLWNFAKKLWKKMKK